MRVTSLHPLSINCRVCTDIMRVDQEFPTLDMYIVHTTGTGSVNVDVVFLTVTLSLALVVCIIEDARL